MCARQPCFDLSTESDAIHRSLRSPQEELEYFRVLTPSATLSGSVSCSTSRSSSTLASSDESGVSIYPHHSLYNTTFSHAPLHTSVDVLDADVYPPSIGVPAVFSLTQSHTHQHPHPPTQHSHSSHSPASYASYTTTTTGSSVDSFPTTGSSMVEYPPVGEKSGSASGSASISGSISSNVGLEAPQGRAGVEMGTAAIVPGRGHGNSASVSTVTGSPALGTVHAQSGTVMGEPAHQAMGENRLGHGHSHRPTQYVPLAQAPTRGHGQTQAPPHQPRHPHPSIHPQGQISGASHLHKGYTAPTAHATVPRSTQRQAQYAAPVLPSSAPGKAGTSGTATTTGKRGRAPKRLRASLAGPAVGVGKSGPAGGGGGGDSDDDSEDDEGGWEPAGDDGGGQHGGVGLSGGRK